MTWVLDVLLLLCFLLTVVAGARAGFFRELFALVGVAGGVTAGLRFSQPILAKAPPIFHQSTAAWIIVFLAVFLVTYFLASLLGAAFASLWEGKKPSGLSHGLGLVLGGVRGFILVLFLAGTMVLLAPAGNRVLGRSLVLPRLSPGMAWASSVLPTQARERLLRKWSLLPFQQGGERKDQPGGSSMREGLSPV